MKTPPGKKIVAFGLTFPEAWVDHPWGDTALKVRKKAFVFAGEPDGDVSFSVKLPVSGPEVLEELEQASPTGYGLGKHGWVSIRLPQDTTLPFLRIEAWIEESYRAVAPKTLAKQIEF